MRYTKAAEYILHIPKFTKKNELDNTKKLLKELGNPQHGKKIIHVAGTNGKGSVCAYLSSIFKCAGISNGVFSSPHLEKINERFCINGEAVSDDMFVEAFEIVKGKVDKLEKQGILHPTFFEFLFCMALVIFQQCDVEFIILETGLGGRLDATNALDKVCLSVITSIGLDHTEYLGDTLEEIAVEKAGILKKDTPFVYDAGKKVTAAVLEKQAHKAGSLPYPVRTDSYKILRNNGKSIDFLVYNEYYGRTEAVIASMAEYQVANASIAVKAASVLDDVRLSKASVLEGLRKTVWPGRMEKVLPGVIVDGAHNADAMQAFLRSVRTLKKEPLILLFSAVQDKNYEKMIEQICREANFSHIYVTQIKNNRGLKSSILAECFLKYGAKNVIPYDDTASAFENAYKRKEEGLLFCTGSLYLVGEIKEVISNDQF